MTDKPVSHETAETVIEKAPKALIEKLPDCIESREAKRLIDVTADLVHQAIENGERVR